MSSVRSYVNGYLSNRMRFPADPPTAVPPLPPNISLPEMKFQYWQEIAVNEMTIDHMLGFRPAAITLLSADGLTRFMSFGVSYMGENRIIINTDLKFRGWVLIS
jgi:hypothetical protein